MRTISSGKSASFPVMGRAKAAYLGAGKSLDEIREAIPHNEKIIGIDGLLTMREVVVEINQDYQNQLDTIKANNPYDDLEMSGSRAVWPEVLSVYAVKTTTDPDNPQEAASGSRAQNLQYTASRCSCFPQAATARFCRRLRR